MGRSGRTSRGYGFARQVRQNVGRTLGLGRVATNVETAAFYRGRFLDRQKIIMAQSLAKMNPAVPIVKTHAIDSPTIVVPKNEPAPFVAPIQIPKSSPAQNFAHRNREIDTINLNMTDDETDEIEENDEEEEEEDDFGSLNSLQEVIDFGF